MNDKSGGTGEVHTALQFTEEMKGYLGLGEADFQQGFAKGQAENTHLMFHLTVDIQDVERFVTNPRHEAPAAGYVECDALGGRLAVEQGTFNLFVYDDDPARRRMLYHLFFRGGDGQPLTFSGFKDIRDDKGFDVWSDTTTLYTRILRGHIGAEEEPQAEIVGSGIIRIHVPGFLKQLASFRVEGPTIADRATALARFGFFFLGRLWDVYARERLTSDPS